MTACRPLRFRVMQLSKMAFVPILPFARSCPRTAPTLCPHPTMKVGLQPVGRRAVLQLAVVGIGLSFVRSAEAKFNIEEINYDDEVVEVGPDPVEKNITRTKKKAVEPKFRKEKKDLLTTTGKKFREMISKEVEESADLKAQFSK